VGPFDTFAVATELASSRENGRAYDLVNGGAKEQGSGGGVWDAPFAPDTTILKAPVWDTLINQVEKGCVRANVAGQDF